LPRWDVLPGNRASEHLVDELELAAARKRLDLDLAVGELSVSAGLLLVPSMRIGRPRDRFPIRNFRRMEDDVDSIFLLQFGDDDLHVKLPLAAEQQLFRLPVEIQPDTAVRFADA